MKGQHIFLLFLLLLSGFMACKKESPYDFSDSPEKTMIYMTEATQGANGIYPVTIAQLPGLPPDTVYKYSFGAYYPGNDPAPSDIDVRFALDFSKLDSINAVETAAGREAYLPLPDSVYTIDGLSGTIAAKSRVLDNLHINISSGKIQPNVKYILPIAIDDISGGYKANPALKVTYFTVTAKDPIPGTYKASGHLTYYGNGTDVLADYDFGPFDRTITKIAASEYRVVQGVSDWAAGDFILHINDDNTVTISGGLYGALNELSNYNGTSTFDLSKMKFVIRYKVMDGGSFEAGTENLEKK